MGPHPLAPTHDAIIARQQFRNVTDTDLFGEQSVEPDEQALRTLRDNQPAAHTQLGAFAEASLALYQDHGLVPDLSRPGNLMLCDAGNLLLIDGEPIRSRDPDAPRKSDRNPMRGRAASGN